MKGLLISGVGAVYFFEEPAEILFAAVLAVVSYLFYQFQ
jgi:hypothetical protein